ncbi:uncharacterized protein LOC114523137 isoform X2 [Dendronephthya gigantea]|uniref:uncharacterized protein LOC114523137 isoform X2 n=1 Tax=Dendronephthya gigantea TaxID=151771 RepID=UPI00106BE8ED|nr:uncharacterized protein LOC114523137 isoform X2 [Dendronephthya gigantea]
MPLLLEHCGLNLKSATIVIGCFSIFFSIYRIIKDVTMITALKSIEDEDGSSDLPSNAIPDLLKILYVGTACASMLFLFSWLLLLGIWKEISGFIFLWLPASALYILMDLAVVIYCGVVYTDVSDIGLTIGLTCFGCALEKPISLSIYIII